MTTPMIGIYRAKRGCCEALVKLVEENFRLLASKRYLSGTPTIVKAVDGIIASFKYAAGGAEKAHRDPDVLALWDRFQSVCDMLALKAYPMGIAEIRGVVLISGSAGQTSNVL